MIPCPEPGIYRAVPMETYHAWDAVGNSHLGKLKLSPYHYRWTLDNGQEQTEAMKLGSAAHMAVLEWDLFVARYAPHIEGRRNTREVKDDMERIRMEGREPLRPSEWDMIHEWRQNIDRHEKALAMLSQATDVEVSIVWDQVVEEKRVVRCKARPDVLCELDGRPICNDLKTSRSAHRAAFGKACVNYGYDRGAAHYLAGLKAVGMPCDDYVYTVLEKGAPFLVATYDLDAQSAENGRNEWWRLLSLLAECRERNEWPGYSEEIEPLSLPTWSPEVELELTMGGEALEV